MVESVAIAGVAARVGRLPGLEAAIRATVLEALEDAGFGSLDEIDSVVTVGSDILDGGMVATRSGLAGSYSRSLVTVPSSSGHALGAAVAMIEAGDAGNTLLVGWGEGTNFENVDGRIIQADPFYTRPLGADAATLSALQAQWLLHHGRVDRVRLDRYAQTMGARAGSGSEAPSEGVPLWLRTTWSDGVCALVLTASAPSPGSVSIADFGTSFQPYCPEPGDLDPAGWVTVAQAGMREPGLLEKVDPVAVEVCGPSQLVEAAAISGLLEHWGWQEADARVNRTGGGATAYFGPATGLRQIVSATTELRANPESSGASAVVVDLGGPIGQATTVLVVDRRSA